MTDAGPKIGYDPNALQRMGFMTGMADLLREFGFTVEQAIGNLPIELQAFSDPERRVPFSLFCQVILRGAIITGCPHFGLQLGARHSLGCLGAPGQLMAHAPNLEAALTAFVGLQPTNSRAAAAYLHRCKDHVVLGYGIYDRSAIGHEQAYASAIAVAFNGCLALTRGVARPEEVLFSFRRPANIRPYNEFFKAPVRFDQPKSGLILPLSALAAPIPGARADEFERLKTLAAALAPVGGHTWTGRVRHAIRPMLSGGDATIKKAAAEFGFGARTLTRYLKAEGTSFQRILDDIRFSVARELMTITDLSISDIADSLAYSAHAPFIKAFRRWSGATPSEWRKTIHARRRS